MDTDKWSKGQVWDCLAVGAPRIAASQETLAALTQLLKSKPDCQAVWRKGEKHDP